MLELKDIHKTFNAGTVNEKVALNGVNLTLAEGDLAPVSCLQRNAAPCRQAAECHTLPVWRGYYDMTRQYFSDITLADLMNTPQGDNYVI